MVCNSKLYACISLNILWLLWRITSSWPFPKWQTLQRIWSGQIGHLYISFICTPKHTRDASIFPYAKTVHSIIPRSHHPSFHVVLNRVWFFLWEGSRHSFWGWATSFEILFRALKLCFWGCEEVKETKSEHMLGVNEHILLWSASLWAC